LAKAGEKFDDPGARSGGDFRVEAESLGCVKRQLQREKRSSGATIAGEKLRTFSGKYMHSFAHVLVLRPIND
jgi:hypothetical protein